MDNNGFEYCLTNFCVTKLPKLNEPEPDPKIKTPANNNKQQFQKAEAKSFVSQSLLTKPR
ncbi:hypothetical protein ACTXT7_007138 [Hymenolepis weldensis]